MGILHEGHSKRKINKDPNNTKWTRDTNTFGQKILRAQGWQPGQFLGAENAPHSELHTAANASYIRVVLKDDMKGLGFNRAKEDEVTGLGVFQDLLSRLNGKSEAAVEEDRQARLAVKTHHYVEQRYGPMRFVRGGLLVGDQMKEEKDEGKSSEASTSETETQTPNSEDVEMGGVDSVTKKDKKDKKSKKRKASDADDDTSDREPESKSKKRRKEERKMKATEDSADDSKAKKRAKKDKERSRSKESTESSQDESTTEKEKSKKRKSKSKDMSQSPEESEDEQVKESKKSKKSKKERKEKEKKEKKKRRKEESKSSNLTTVENTPAESRASTGTSTPTLATSGTSTPQGSRNFVRSRFIAQKKQAVLDTKALAQIFMVKA